MEMQLLGDLEAKGNLDLVTWNARSEQSGELAWEEAMDLYIHTYTHTYIPRIHKCVTKTVGCGKSHKYATVQICSVKYYEQYIKEYYIKEYYRSSFHIRNSSTQYKQCVCGCFVGVLWVFCGCFVGVFWRLLEILCCHSWGLSNWVVDCWKFLCKHRTYFYENR
jgi:hypothetical protein